ncbi:MAG: Gldg family protein [Bacteroidota bacterium]
MKKNISKGLYNWTFLGFFLAGIIIINIIAAFAYYRVDMTEDKRYSLSEGTIAFLKDDTKIQNRLTIKIYLEGNLPAQIKMFRNAIEDKLKEFKQFAGDRIEYIFINPAPENSTEAEQQTMFEGLYAKGKGVLPMDITYQQDGSQSQMMLWPGAVIDYEGSTVNTIQFLPGTTPGKPYNLDGLDEIISNSINNLEYMLISSIRRATQKTKPRIAFLHGHNELNFAQTQRARALISNYYNIADVSINDSIDALKGFDGVIIARPQIKFSDKDLYVIDQFVMNGGRLMCFMDALHVDEDTLKTKGVTHTLRYGTGLERMLFDYGLKLNDNLVVDVNCAPRTAPYAKQSLIPWFFHVLATPTSHPISRNVDPVSLKYVSEVQFIESEKVALTPILTSSTNSNVTGLAPMVSLGMPMNYGNKPELNDAPTDEANKICLGGLAEGSFQSHFKNRLVDEFAKSKEANYQEESKNEGKVILIGNGTWIANQYDSMPAKNGTQYQYRPKQVNDLRMDPELAELRIPLFFGNQEFFQNLVDYMMGDNSVIDIRSRQIDIKKIDSEKVKANAGFYKIMNLLVPISSILLLAFVMANLRKRKYTR